MADFLTAFKLTGHAEGGYANNPDDHGGETYAGIARKFWPKWEGWAIIDSFKGQPKFISIVNSSQQLKNLLPIFYKQNFWDVNKLNQINDQQIANAVYDFGMNAGVKTSAEKLQIALGIMVDGIIGEITLKAVNAAPAKTTLDFFNEERIQFYNRLALNPGQKQFLASWLSRIKPYQA